MRPPGRYPVGWSAIPAVAAVAMLSIGLAPPALALAQDTIVQQVTCVAPRAPGAGTQITSISAAQSRMAFTGAWQFTRGSGVTVAVIDTGVSRHPWLGDRVISGVDLVVPTEESRVDCDGHGTLVAGLIAGAADEASGFSGVAPEALVLSIRQASARYDVVADDKQRSRRPVGDVATLAVAIRDAIAGHASVINISQTGCVAAGPRNEGDDELARAIDEAADADIVVVAAAGNLGHSCTVQNLPGQPPLTIPVPAKFDSVLTVGALARDGSAADFSLAGPWVDIAAPGTDIVSLDPSVGAAGLVNQQGGAGSQSPISGTSFAAPYVSGVVALVRAAHPELTAPQVIARLTATAQHPPAAGNRTDSVGYGMIDAMAAVSAVMPAQSTNSALTQLALPEFVRPSRPDRHPRSVALLASGIALAGLVLAAGGILAVRRAGRIRRR